MLDAILLGAVGGPQWERLDRALRPEQGSAGAARGAWAVRQPAAGHPLSAACRGLDAQARSRQRSGSHDRARAYRRDLFWQAARHPRTREDGQREGFNTLVYSESEIDVSARSAFGIARKRAQRLCSVDKANVLESSELWREVMVRTADEYHGCRTESHVCGQCRHATGAGTETVRRHGDHPICSVTFSRMPPPC